MHKIVLVFSLLFLLPAVASAQDAAAAKRLFQSGSQHFDLGEYREALGDFKEGYRLKDDPVFLYNIGQCHRQLNENLEAIRAFKTYLSRRPDAPNRAEVERKIADLREAMATQEKASSTPPTHVLPPEHSGSAPTTGAPTTGAPTTGAPTAGESAAQPAPAAAESPALTGAAPPPEHKPLYKKWWLWATVGVVVVGTAVALGVGLSQSSSQAGTVFPGVQF